MRKFPDDVLNKLRTLSFQVLEEEAAKDPISEKVYASFRAFQDSAMKYHVLTEQAYMNARNAD